MNKHYHNLYSLLFLTIALIDILAVAYRPELRVASKPLLMVTLGLGFWFSTKSVNDYRKHLMLAAISFAFLGDVLLINDDLFLYGLGGFLMMQLLYSYLFFFDKNYWGLREITLGIGLLVAVVSIIYFMEPHLGSLIYAVGIYSVAIGMMCFSAFTRDLRSMGYWPIFFGSVLFVVSDAVLAINRFHEPLYMGGVIVMLTYLVGQYLIVSGYTDYIIDRKQTK